MNKFNLGLIGRCTSLQPWIHPSVLYHRQLKTLLKERDGIDLDVHLASKSQLPPAERLLLLHHKIPLDGVLYHMRPIKKNGMFNSTRDPSGKLSYSLHPNLLKRTSYSFAYNEVPFFNHLTARKMEDVHNCIPIPVIERKILGISLRKMNLFAGQLVGLNLFQLKNEWFFIKALKNLCLELNLPLFILGPIPQVHIAESGNRSFREFPPQKTIQSRLSEEGVPHYLLKALYNEKGMPLHKRIGTHLSPEGHTFLAHELYPHFSKWIRSVTSSKPDTDLYSIQKR